MSQAGNDLVIWGKFKLILTSKGLTRRSASDKRGKNKNLRFLMLLQLDCKTIDFPILNRHTIGAIGHEN